MSELSIAESIKQDYEEEINKQAKVIQWYEKENRHNQEIILKDTKEIERLNNIIGEAIDRAIHIQKTFGYVLDDLIYLLIQGSDKE